MKRINPINLTGKVTILGDIQFKGETYKTLLVDGADQALINLCEEKGLNTEKDYIDIHISNLYFKGANVRLHSRIADPCNASHIYKSRLGDISLCSVELMERFNDVIPNQIFVKVEPSISIEN